MLFRRAHHFISSRQLPMSKNPMPKKHKLFEIFNDTQTGMLLGIPRSARCVQRFDDSLNSAIHITYRISLRSSSMREPRDPLLKVVFYHLKGWQKPTISFYRHLTCVCEKTHRHPDFSISREVNIRCQPLSHPECLQRVHRWKRAWSKQQKTCTCSLEPATALPPISFSNDPSAGSPTETLLRLLLPLNDQVWSASQQRGAVAGSPKPIRRPH